jgi:hypothetical protein
MSTNALQAQRMLEDTTRVVRASQEVLRNVPMRLVQSRVNWLKSKALLAESLALASADADKLKRES